MWNNVVFDHVDMKSDYPIYIEKMGGEMEFLTEDGCFNFDLGAKCVIFPKGKTTWEGFVPPCEFKTGDVLFVDCSDDEDRSYQYIFILNDPEFYGKWQSYCYLDGVGCFHSKETYLTDEEYHPRFATEEEKEKLFLAIKDNGYKWNLETKTLEKLVEPSEEEQVGMNELGMMWQKQALIKKACEWLENIDFASEYFYDGEGFFDNAIVVEEFKKAMEK